MTAPIRYTTIYCCGCEKDVEARLITGAEVYFHRKDLHNLHFWRCDTCKNFVGCHHLKVKDTTKPLGCIATKEIKDIRKVIHSFIDPLWKDGYYSRGFIYEVLTSVIGRQYHTAELRTIDESKKVLNEVSRLVTHKKLIRPKE